MGEIIPDHELFDYECKYRPGMAQEIFPADPGPGVSPRVQERPCGPQVLRLGIFQGGFHSGLGRDAVVPGGQRSPGLDRKLPPPESRQGSGISFPQLCHRLAEMALSGRGHEVWGKGIRFRRSWKVRNPWIVEGFEGCGLTWFESGCLDSAGFLRSTGVERTDVTRQLHSNLLSATPPPLGSSGSSSPMW